MQNKIRQFLVLALFLPSTFSIGQESSIDLERIMKQAENDPKEAYQSLNNFYQTVPNLSLAQRSDAIFLEGQLLMEFGLYDEATHKLYQAEELF